MEEKTSKKHIILEEYDDNIRLYQCFLDEIEHQIKSILQTSDFTVNAITSRLKSRESLLGKLKRKPNKYSNLSDITDIVGIRIITYFSEDVDKISDIVENEFEIDRVNSIDRRESMEPDRFGYCSVHYVVEMSKQRLALRECARYRNLKCEIQIRSVLQHAWAEIEHDIGYKSESTIPKEMRRNFSRIAGLLEIADKEFNDIRKNLFEYRNTMQIEIENKTIPDKELDAVVLEVLITQNPDIVKLNSYIENLIGERLEQINDDCAQHTIKRLEWFGIKTVSEVMNFASKYYDTAKTIANKYLANYKDNNKESEGSFCTDIGIFYLCYSMLLKEHCDKESISKYLYDTNIGNKEKLNEIIDKLYNWGLEINI